MFPAVGRGSGRGIALGPEASRSMRRSVVDTILIGPSALLREGLTRILGRADFRIAASVVRLDDIVLMALPRHRSYVILR